MRYDSLTQKWFATHVSKQTTVVRCDKCGEFYKPILGHRCKVKEQTGENKDGKDT